MPSRSALKTLVRLSGRLALVGLLTLSPLWAQEGLEVFRGTLHDHTAEGGDDGKQGVEEAIAAATQAGYDFFALTPHNHMIQDSTYAALRAKAEAADRAGPVIFSGFEWGSISKGGHLGVFGTKDLSHAKGKEWPRFWSFLKQHQDEDPLVVLNHPVWAREYGGAPDRLRDSQVSLVEMIGGPSHHEGPEKAEPDVFHRDVLQVLNQGWRVGFSYGEDDHTGSWGRVTPARLGVWAKEKTHPELLRALKARRTFVTEDKDLTLWFQAGEVPMGGEVPLGTHSLSGWVRSEEGRDLEIAAFVDADGPGGSLAKEVRRVSGGEIRIPLQAEAHGAYAFLVAKDSKGALAWTSPIWFGKAETYLGPHERSANASPSKRIDLNFSGSRTLQEIRGVGKGMARKILRLRDQKKFFLKTQELLEIPELSPEIFREISRRVEVRPAIESARRILRHDADLDSLVRDDRQIEGLRYLLGRAEHLLAAQLVPLLERGQLERVCRVYQLIKAGSERVQERGRRVIEIAETRAEGSPDLKARIHQFLEDPPCPEDLPQGMQRAPARALE